MYFLTIAEAFARTYCLDTNISSLQFICQNYFVYFCGCVVAMVTVWRYILDNKVYNGFKQGQITPNIEHLTLLKHIYLVAQCSKIIDTVLFLNHI